jgi:hypothetical protein
MDDDKVTENDVQIHFDNVKNYVIVSKPLYSGYMGDHIFFKFILRIY